MSGTDRLQHENGFATVALAGLSAEDKRGASRCSKSAPNSLMAFESHLTARRKRP
jgi:hypothetical protein